MVYLWLEGLVVGLLRREDEGTLTAARDRQTLSRWTSSMCSFGDGHLTQRGCCQRAADLSASGCACDLQLYVAAILWRLDVAHDAATVDV